MKMLSRNQSLVAAALAAVTFTMPGVAQAQTYGYSAGQYVECKKDNDENQLVGGLLGAVAGGVIGSQVAGRGARTEGSVLGAVLGGAAGVAIGDDQRDCRDEARAYSTGHYSGTTRGTTYGNSYNNSYGNSYGYGSSGAGTYHPASTRTYRNTYGSGYSTPSYTSVPRYPRARPTGYPRLDRVQRKLERLGQERAELQARNRYDHAPWIDRRLGELKYEIKAVKKRKRRIKREIKERNRSSYHYHGKDVYYDYH